MYLLLRTGVAIAALAVPACGGKPPAPAGAPGGAPGGAMPAMPVEMVTLAPKPLEETVDLVGTVKSRRSTTVQPQAEGIITKIHVTSGQRVTPGATLAEIDAAVPKAAAATLESMRTMRDAELSYAKQQAQRTKTMLDVGAASQQQYEQAITAQKTAEAQLKAVEEQIRQQQAELDYYRVVAPTAGIIGDIPVREGDRVTKATVLTTIDDISGLEAYLGVPVQHAAELRPGLPVRIVDDTGKTLAETKVSFVAPSVDDTTQTVLIKAPVETTAGRFRTDQFVRALLVVKTAPGLTIPVVSVTRINGQYFAFVAEKTGTGWVAHQRPVVLGAVMGNEYRVVSGLNAGDTIIVSGLQKIGEGAPVQPAPKAPGPPGGDKPPAAGGRG